MDTTVRATCPQCRNVLRIPSQWVGQAVKCKKCGTVVRSKAKGGELAEATADTAPQNAAVPEVNAFDFNQPSAEDDMFPLPEPFAPPEVADDRFDPTGGADVSSQPPAAAPQPPAPMPGMPPGMPGYPYPMPPGYPAPAPGYGPPPGYPYAPPPGYPYPMPPGYPPPGAAAPPGYPYPMPPGYPAPGYGPPPGYPYAPPPGYPYGTPPGAMPPGPVPGMPAAPAAGAPAYPTAPAPTAPKPSAAPPAPKLSGAVPMPAPALPSPNGVAKPGQPAKPGAPAPAPKQAAPAAAPKPAPHNEFRTGDSGMVATNPGRYKKSNGKSKLIWGGVCLLLTAVMVAAAIMGAKYANEKFGKDKKETASGDKQDPHAAPAPGANPAHKSGPFPRRMLFVHISRYMFLNPLTAGMDGGEDRTRGAAMRLANEWNVPFDPKDTERNQLYLLSDTARPDNPRSTDTLTPMKNVVVGAYEQFFATSRAQDRIVMYFGGHALEKDGKAYIAPIEGDLDDPEPTLIPLDEIYGKLKACKATQKVVIWDVCRYNPQRGQQRPGSEPMTETLYKSLASAPAGVEVLITCQPGENALEFSNIQVDAGATATTAKFAGSAFLESMKYVAAKSTRSAGKQPAQTDPIAVSDWAAAVGKRVTDMATSPAAKDARTKGAQTIKVEGKPPASWVAFNPDEPIAKRFDFPAAPKGTSPTEVAAIVNEMNVPSIKVDLIDAGLAALPFRDEVMKDYKSDVTLDMVLKDKDNYKFQAKTFEAIDTIRKMWQVTPGGGTATSGSAQIRNDFKAPVSDALKNEIKKEQDFWAIGVATLELLNSELDSLAPMRDAQAKRWQAHYDYARATVKARLAYMNEYNKLLGDVLTETLPSLDAKLGQDRYKLVSTEKMKSKKDVQQLAAEAKETYEKLITEHKATPWSIQAKRDKAFALGLSWQPISSGTIEP